MRGFMLLLVALFTTGMAVQSAAADIPSQEGPASARETTATPRDNISLALGVPLAAPSREGASEVLDRPARLDVRDVSLIGALNTLRHGAGIALLFSPDFVPDVKVACECRDATVADALDRILHGTNLEFITSGDQVIVSQRSEAAETLRGMVPAAANLTLARPVSTGMGTFGRRPLPAANHAIRQGTITGQVTNAETMQPLPGAQVMLNELERAALAQNDGTYTISDVPAGTYQVQVGMIGYGTLTQEVTVVSGETSTLDFSLRSAAISLDAVVVTGAGVQEQRRQLGYASGSIGAADIEARPVQNVTQALRGQIAGVMPSAPMGETGAGSPMRIRGHASLTQRNEPLLIVDGVRQDGSLDDLKNMMTSRLDDINPNDIERIEVMKGAAAATLFGTEASAGVIQIFTKQGLEGPPQYSFSMDQGASQIPIGRIHPNRAYDFDTGTFVEQHPMKDILGTGHVQNYNLSISGGVPRFNYFVSGRFMQDGGAVPRSRADNVSVRSRFDMNHTDKLSTELGLNVIRNRVRTPTGGLSIGILGIATFSNPLFADPEANLPYGESLYSLADAMGGKALGLVNRYSADLRATYRWTPNLTSQAVFGYTRVDSRNSETIELGDANLARGNTTGRRDIRDSERSQMTLDFNTSWQSQFTDDLGFQLWGGGQAFFEEEESSRVHTTDFAAPGLTTFQSGAAIQDLNEGFEEVVNAGVFGQAQIDFRDRLYLTGGLRADGNSAFGEDFGMSLYPKLSTSYVVSDEDFWLAGGTWSLLRLRGAWGQSGLQPGAFDAVQTWNPRTRLGGAVVWPGNVGNPDLKPERSSELEVGADLGFFDDRVGMELTYYNTTTTDVIVPRPLPASLGFRQSQLVNIGSMEASGVEALVNWNVVQRPDYSWSITATAGTVNEKVTDLGIGDDEFQVSGGLRARSFVAEGQPPGVFKTEVLDEDDPYSLTVDSHDELTRLDQIIANPLKDGDGENVLVFSKSAVPNVTGSFGTTIGLPGDITVRALFSGAAGFAMFSQADVITYQNGVRPDASGLAAELDDPSTSTERRREIALEHARKSNTIWGNWIEDGDYIRFQELSVVYRVPDSFAARVGLDRLSVNLAAQNLALWTKFTGVGDPGLAAQSTRSVLVNDHRMHLPSARTLTLSLQGGW